MASLRKSRIIKFISSNSTLILNHKLLQHKSTMGEHSFFQQCLSSEVSHATEIRQSLCTDGNQWRQGSSMAHPGHLLDM